VKVTPEIAAAFESIARSMALMDGFTLIPVEVTGPDLGRALAAWLGERGQRTRVIEPLDEPGWRAIVASMLDDADEGDARTTTMVLGPRALAPGMAAGLSLLNQRRDSIVSGLAHPLLWCGPLEFLKATWERAPDLWSIRGMTHRVLAAARAHAESPLWPGIVVRDAPERLRETLESARAQGDATMIARVSVQLAEALLASGEFTEANEVIARAREESVDGGALALLEARAASALGDATRAKSALDDATKRASTPPAHIAVTRGNLGLRHDAKRALGEYENAIAAAHATGDKRNEAVALADRGVAELALGDADEALTHLETARAILRDAGDERGEARTLAHVGRTHAALFDARTAAACFEEALDLVRDQGDVRGEARVRCHLARAYLEIGDAEKAREDAAQGLVLARLSGDDHLVARAEEALAAASAASASETPPR
jgi:tetratricopeptide (TPR) repeat protein